jgi:hypothetical protein
MSEPCNQHDAGRRGRGKNSCGVGRGLYRAGSGIATEIHFHQSNEKLAGQLIAPLRDRATMIARGSDRTFDVLEKL